MIMFENKYLNSNALLLFNALWYCKQKKTPSKTKRDSGFVLQRNTAVELFTKITIFNRIDSSYTSLICFWKSEPVLHSQGSIQQLEGRAPFSGKHLLDNTLSEFEGFHEKSELVFMLVLPCSASRSCYIPGSLPPANLACQLKKRLPLTSWIS